ncbi:MAG TPA: cytochrome c biogenesis protein CcsA [Balneolaceae bacterium]|nr:cytochrome c biogenesis protein CcsA [Balneolaceae bacterium]
MTGIIGKILVDVSFICMLAAAVYYFVYSKKDNDNYFRTASWLFGLQGLFIAVASGLLLYLILTHQYNYYYVYNYTSTDLQLKYLISAYWGGQEGSFMLWILFSTVIGLVLIKRTKKPYRGPVLFFLSVTQLFLLSMLLGFHIGDLKIGASPFRTLAEAMPNAPFLQSNPGWVPPDGKGLNDLLRSPWMMIHPPILFLSFSLLTVPCCFALAALWKRKYHEWVRPALPWTLAANLGLLFALFLGGYWAYVTLSFGGFWAWDPVENAALVPWLFGIAGIHTMIINKKSSSSQKASIIFALLAYLAVVYESFLTRSGILSDASVHSFVDLGLYNQLLLFMAVMLLTCLGLFVYRYKDLPRQNKGHKIMSREFMTFGGAMVLFLLALVITIGTSSPVIGKLFTQNPTPPEISFYNQWTMPLAIIAALLTVIGQFLFWERQTVESLARRLLAPVAISCGLTLITTIAAAIQDFYIIIFVFSGWFALFGNAFVMARLIKKRPKLIGGALSHVGFGILLLGIISSSFFSEPLLTPAIHAYNRAVEQGKMTDENGMIVQQKATFIQLNLKEPKVVNDKYILTWVGYQMEPDQRPGQHRYKY